MTVAVVALWNDVGCPHRQAAWTWLQGRLAAAHPDWPVVVGAWTGDVYSRSQAIINGAQQTDADTLVVTDADVWCDGLPEAVAAVEDGQFSWAVPHTLLHRLAPESTDLVLAGSDWRGLPL